MIDKRDIIRRVYEKGRETTLVSKKQAVQAKKRKPGTSAPTLTRRTAGVVKSAEFVQRKAAPLDHYELSPYYGATRLTLMVKDPFWIYAYWEIAPDSLKSLKRTLAKEEINAAKTVLRMYDVTLIDFNGSNANSYFDVEVADATNWYISLWSDKVSYVGEIGLRLPDGRFFALARSNYVHTPRSGFSPRGEQIWMKVEEEKPPSAYVVPRRETTPTEKKKPFPSAVAPAKKRKDTIYVTEEDIRNYYARLSLPLREIILSRIAKIYGRKKLEQLDFILKGKAQKEREFILEGETQQERERILSMLPKDYLRRLLLGASEEFFIGASEALPKGGASEFISQKVQLPHFFFDIATELIVYGRTEPDAEVWLGNKKLNLHKDGTFTLRFALPDGQIPLEFTAVSHDKKRSRKINTYIHRHTNSTG